MGTNYYMMKQGNNGKEKLVHLGKKSCGWNFLFRGDKSRGVDDWARWFQRVKALNMRGYEFWNDNGSMLTLEEFFSMASKREEKSQEAVASGRDGWTDSYGYTFYDKEFC